MKKNMGTADRLIRTLIGVFIIILFLSNVITGTWGYILLAVAAIFILTSAIGVCPLYSLFGIGSAKAKKA